jgi:hypothetical protein
VIGTVILQENQELKLRREAFHIFLHLPGRELPNRAVSNTQFGAITSTVANTRHKQFALKDVLKKGESL